MNRLAVWIVLGSLLSSGVAFAEDEDKDDFSPLEAAGGMALNGVGGFVL